MFHLEHKRTDAAECERIITRCRRMHTMTVEDELVWFYVRTLIAMPSIRSRPLCVCVWVCPRASSSPFVSCSELKASNYVSVQWRKICSRSIIFDIHFSYYSAFIICNIMIIMYTLWILELIHLFLTTSIIITWNERCSAYGFSSFEKLRYTNWDKADRWRCSYTRKATDARITHALLSLSLPLNLNVNVTFFLLWFCHCHGTSHKIARV